LGKLSPEIRKLCVVKTYTDIEEVVVAAVEIKRVLGELAEAPYEPMKEEQDETMSRESTTDRQLHVLNKTFINFFGKGTIGKVGPSIGFSFNTHNRCQLCHSKKHTTSTCLKLTNTMPKCAKCGSGHKTDNCGLKCSLCFGLGHTEERCWKKPAKGLLATINFLEVLVDDEKAILVKLSHVCGEDQHIFFGVRIPKKRLPIIANPTEEQAEERLQKMNREEQTWDLKQL